MDSAFLPAPYGGVNRKTPIAVLKNPYCETLVNFNTTEAGVELRKGDSIHTANLVSATNATDSFLTFIKYGDIGLFYTTQCDVTQNRYFDATTAGAATLAHTSTSGINGDIFSVYFNKYVFIFGTAGAGTGGDQYDGSAWAAWGWTLPATFYPIGGCAYNHRAYFIGRISAEYAYGGIDAITGVLTKVDLAGVILEQSYLSTIAPVTISQNGNNLTLLAFVFYSGEVLFYTGSYPDGSDWTLAGRGKIGKPLTYNSFIDYQGDALVLTRTGLVSLRDVFLSGSQDATTKTVSDPINPLWGPLVTAIIAERSTFVESTGRIVGASGDWWVAKDRILVSFPFHLDSTGVTQFGTTFFVFDTERGSWSIHLGAGSNYVFALAEFKDSIYINGYSAGTASAYLVTLKKEGGTDFQDAYNNVVKTNYDFEMISPPIPYKKDAVYTIGGIEPIIESDLYAETNWKLIADFGRQETSAQVTNALTTSVQKPLVNIGITANFAQVKMYGTTAASKTVGLDLYGYNVWFDAGEKGSR